MLLNKSEDPWVRTFVLRALAHREIGVSEVAFAQLLDEFSQALPEQNRGDWPLAGGVEELTTVMSLPLSDQQRVALLEFVDELPREVTRKLLLWMAVAASRPSRKWTERVYERYSSSGPLDERVAWATFEQPASQDRVLDSESIDFELLSHAAW